MHLLARFTRHLRPIDTLIALFLVALTGVYAFAASTPLDWIEYLLFNACIIGAIVTVAAMASRSRAIQVAYDFYPTVMILLIFKEVHVLIQSMVRGDLDHVLIAIDRAIFGTDPTRWIARFASPPVTEILQIAYVSYYLLMIVLGVELYRR